MTATDVPRYRRLGALVDRRIGRLQKSLPRKPLTAPAAAALAQLRRGAGKRIGEAPEVFRYTEISDLIQDGTPDTPTWQEEAAHLALTLYALHQQSQGQPMHRPGVDLGAALRALHPKDFDDVGDPVLRRFQTLVTADSLGELTHHLRGVVQLLRAAGQPLDYALLADQLVTWQAGGRARVRLAWGRAFYRTPDADDTSSQTTES